MTTTSTPSPGFVKANAGKNLLGCLPPKALLSIGRVLTFGAAKYSRDNRHKAPELSIYYDALLRHLFAWWSGEDLDGETQQNHLAHAGCCLLFLLELVERGIARDDRPMIPENAETLALRERIRVLEQENFQLRVR